MNATRKSPGLVKLCKNAYRTEDCTVFVERSILPADRARGKWGITHRGYPLGHVDTIATARRVIRDLYETA